MASDGAEGSTTASKDTPQNDPVNILLKKVDSRTYESTPQGGATLKDAEFTVYYYDTTDATSLSKEHDTRVSKATKKWVYKTDKYGTIDIQKVSPIEGSDETFKAADGKTNTLPIGTYVIEETYPPEGYINPENPDNRCYIEVIKSDGAEAELLSTFHKETYSPCNNVTVTNSEGKEITYTGLGWDTWKPLNEKFSK